MQAVLPSPTRTHAYPCTRVRAHGAIHMSHAHGHTQSYTRAHTCACTHTEPDTHGTPSHSYTHANTHRALHTITRTCVYSHRVMDTHTHSQSSPPPAHRLQGHARDMREIFSRSFCLHSPILPLPSPLNLPLPSPFPGHLLQFYQQEHKSTMCQASLIPCGLEVTRSSKQSSGMGARAKWRPRLPHLIGFMMWTHRASRLTSVSLALCSSLEVD